MLEALAFGNSLGKKMKHPGTFNANPLSSAAGCAALDVVATGEPSRVANQQAARLRRGLNELFVEKSIPWVAYGDFSAIKIIPGYDGPAADGDDRGQEHRRAVHNRLGWTSLTGARGRLRRKTQTSRYTPL